MSQWYISQKKYNFLGGELTLTVTEDLIPKFYLDGSFYFLSSLPFIPDSSSVEFYGDYAFVSFSKKKSTLDNPFPSIALNAFIA